RRNGSRLPPISHHELAPWGSDIVGLRRDDRSRRGRSPPSPPPDLGHVVPVPGDVLLVIDELVVDGLLRVGGPSAELRHSIDDVAHEVESIELVHYANVERRTGRPFSLVPGHM